MLKVNDHAGAHHVDSLAAKDARGQQVKDKLAPIVDNGVACVIAALIADDYIVFLAEQVNHSALTLVSPVGADYCC